MQAMEDLKQEQEPINYVNVEKVEPICPLTARPCIQDLCKFYVMDVNTCEKECAFVMTAQFATRIHLLIKYMPVNRGD